MKLGLCCISEILKADKHAFRTMTRKSALSGKLDTLGDLINHNLDHLERTVRHCAEVGISHYRLSSSMFPLIGEKTVGLGIDYLHKIGADKRLNQIGGVIRDLGVTISSHPSQYIVLPSLNLATVENAIFDLELHGWLHDNLGLPKDYSNPINIHVGIASYNPDEIHANFMRAFDRLSLSVQSRLVLENDDKSFWNAENLYDYFARQFPLTLDNLHFDTNPSGLISEWFQKFKDTWDGFTPVFHWSEGGAKGKPRSHVDYATHIPKIVADNLDVTWEVELKSKDLAILEILSGKVLTNS